MRSALRLLVLEVVIAQSVPTSRGGVIFRDSFDAPNSANLDTSAQTGRRTGSDPEIQVRSARIQHGITNGQLNFLNNWSGRLRFHDDPDFITATTGAWHDWAANNGPEILAAGGLRVEFDWASGNSVSTEWVGFNVGHNGESAGEPAYRVLDASTDAGILFRFDGRTDIWDNGVSRGGGGMANPVVGLRHVRIDYSFTSFANGAPIRMDAWVGSVGVYSGNFTWSGNAGRLFMELETNENTRIDNLSISTIPRTPLESWRLAHFGTASDTGNAANNADPDKDGVENLAEFAFALNPKVPDAAGLPVWQLSDDDYSLTFARPPGVSGITYVAEHSTSLAAGSWTPAENVGTPPAYTFLAPAVRAAALPAGAVDGAVTAP